MTTAMSHRRCYNHSDVTSVWVQVLATTSTGYRAARRKAASPAAIAWPAFACQRREVTSAASVELRMLAHSMNTLGMVERLVPAKSLRGWIPAIPSYELTGSPVPCPNALRRSEPRVADGPTMALLIPSATGSRVANPRPPGGPPSAWTETAALPRAPLPMTARSVTHGPTPVLLVRVSTTVAPSARKSAARYRATFQLNSASV